MIPILAVEILKHTILTQSIEGRAVRLSKFRHEYGVPASTFYRHVRALLNARLIMRVGRDEYSVHTNMMIAMGLILVDANDVAIEDTQEYRDVQKSMFG